MENETRRIVQESGACRLNQFDCHGAFAAHYHGTAPEIWKQSDGNFDAFVDFVGSAGTFAGCASLFKKACARAHNVRSVSCYIVEPSHAAVLAGALQELLGTEDNHERDDSDLGIRETNGEHVIQVRPDCPLILVR